MYRWGLFWNGAASWSMGYGRVEWGRLRELMVGWDFTEFDLGIRVVYWYWSVYVGLGFVYVRFKWGR